MQQLPRKLILASQSPRRKQLLSALGFEFESRVKNTSEDYPVSLQGKDIALFLAKKKADAFREEIKNDELIITADTIVWLNGESLAKPGDPNEAAAMLEKLSGQMHEVFTGVCLLNPEKNKSFVVRTEVYFKKLSAEQIGHYISVCKPFDKAGSYGAQDCLPAGVNPCSEDEIAFLKKTGKTELIEKIINRDPAADKDLLIIEQMNGSYFNVMGLPLTELYESLIQF